MDTTLSMAGNVGTDIDYTAGDGYSFASFRLAATPRIRRLGEWTDGETVWLTVQAVNRTAENVRASIHKGDPVLVIGRLRARRWVGQDGQRHEKLVLEARSIGHDLARGTSSFVRNERTSHGPATPTAENDAPLAGSAEETVDEVEACESSDRIDDLDEQVAAAV